MTELLADPRTSEAALRQHGFTPERLVRLSHAVARDYCRLKGATLGDRMEDLVSALTEEGLKVALGYDPTRSGKGYTFASYMYDKLYLAVEPQFFRRKREGFGDRRSGSDGRIKLVDEFDDADPDVDFEHLVDERRRGRWQQAAIAEELTLSEWIAVSLDLCAKHGNSGIRQALSQSRAA